MTLSAKTITTAVAAAIAAAAVLTTVAIPAQAGYQRAPHVKRKITKAKKYHVLKCLSSKGDVVAQPLVINNSGKIFPIGAKIWWTVTMTNGSTQKGLYTLTSPLYVGQSRMIPHPVPVSFTCWVSAWA